MMRVFSLTVFVLIALSWAPPVRADVQRFAVLIGSNRGHVAEPALRFAESDAERLQEVLQDVGSFLPENTLLLKHEGSAGVQRALISMNDRVRAAKSRPGTQVMLLVYFSGHADAQALHLGVSRLELDLLEKLVRSSAADFRILIVDACRSGALTRSKGGSAAPPFVVQVEPGLAGEGTVFLAATSANEDAQESDQLRGSFFTHYLRSGLLGPADSDGDAQITLEEAYRYAYAHTLRASSRTLSGVQHPTYRYELSGQGRVVLSSPYASRATLAQLAFPPGLDFLLLAGHQDGAVIGEVSAFDKNRVLSVQPGRYFVRGRGPRDLLEGVVEARAGQQLPVRNDQLERTEYARLVRKGATNLQIAHGPIAGYAVRTRLENSSAACHGAFAGYAAALRYLTLSMRLDYCSAGFDNRDLSASADAYGLVVRGAYSWDARSWALQIGASAGAELLRQSFETRGFAPSRNSAAGRFGLDLGVSYEIRAGVFLFEESAIESHVFSLENGSTRQRRTEASIALRQQIGLGKWF